MRRSAKSCAGSRAPPSRSSFSVSFATVIAASRHRARYEAWLDAHLPGFDVLPITDATAIAYAGLRIALKRSGHPIPANDAWIAALALEHGLPVLTRDEHFDVVPNLERRDW